MIAWAIVAICIVSLVVIGHFDRIDAASRRQYVQERYSFAPGYQGDPAAWCYWDRENPGEGSCGPFTSRDAAVSHALGLEDA